MLLRTARLPRDHHRRPRSAQSLGEGRGAGGPEKLLAASNAGDAAATAIVERASSALAEAILTLCALVDPGCIVIGGGLAQAPHELVTLAARYVSARASFHRVPPIVPATLGEWAGVNGTVLTALRRQHALV
ncbi:ROK family protein [Microbacterium sp. Se63.02b]|nr:ROK family protein [Microbacterium sp. Se63.02b]